MPKKKPTSCHVCAKQFKAPSKLKTHMRTHDGRKPHVCEECGKSFNQASNLTTHQRIHSGEKPHVCVECGKSFSQPAHLKRHSQKHGGEKSFTCDLCGYSCFDNSSLKLHARRHTKERPYLCNLCPRAFARKPNMEIHMEKPHKVITAHENKFSLDSLSTIFSQKEKASDLAGSTALMGEKVLIKKDVTAKDSSSFLKLQKRVGNKTSSKTYENIEPILVNTVELTGKDSNKQRQNNMDIFQQHSQDDTDEAENVMKHPRHLNQSPSSKNSSKFVSLLRNLNVPKTDEKRLAKSLKNEKALNQESEDVNLIQHQSQSISSKLLGFPTTTALKPDKVAFSNTPKIEGGTISEGRAMARMVGEVRVTGQAEFHRGRRPLGHRALTGAERQQLYARRKLLDADTRAEFEARRREASRRHRSKIPVEERERVKSRQREQKRARYVPRPKEYEGERSHMCEHCPKAYSTTGNLNCHIRKHHKNIGNTEKVSSTKTLTAGLTDQEKSTKGKNIHKSVKTKHKTVKQLANPHRNEEKNSDPEQKSIVSMKTGEESDNQEFDEEYFDKRIEYFEKNSLKEADDSIVWGGEVNEVKKGEGRLLVWDGGVSKVTGRPVFRRGRKKDVKKQKLKKERHTDVSEEVRRALATLGQSQMVRIVKNEF